MKRFKTQRTITIVIMSLCACILARVDYRNALYGDEQRPDNAPQQTVETSPNDFLFEIDPNASNEDVVNAAQKIMMNFLIFSISHAQAVETPVELDSNKRLEIQRRIQEQEKKDLERSDPLFEKFDSLVVPRLLKIVEEDDSSDNNVLSNNALTFCLQTWRYLNKDDEIEKVRERALERYENAKESGDDAKTSNALKRLVIVDKYYLFPGRSPLLGLAKSPSPLAPNRDALVEIGNKLIEEVKRDPFLVEQCGQCYAVMLFTDEDLAMEYREKFRDAISLEEATEALRASKAALTSQEITADDISRNEIIIYRSDTLSESLLQIPKNETVVFYRNRQLQVYNSLYTADSAPVRKAAREEYKRNAVVAIAKLAVRIAYLESTGERSRSIGDTNAFSRLIATPETIAVLNDAVEEEAAKPLDQANARFLSLTRSELLSLELKAAASSGDKDAAFKTLERFANYAESDLGAARKLSSTVAGLLHANVDFAPELLDRLIDKAKTSNGKLNSIYLSLVRMKTTDNGTAPRLQTPFRF